MDFWEQKEQLALFTFHLKVSEKKVSLNFAAVNTIYLDDFGLKLYS